MERQRVEIDTGRCVGCGKCAGVCPAHNLAVREKKAVTVLDDCVMCGQCVAVCPRKAVSFSGGDGGLVEKEGEVRLDPSAVLEVIRFRRSIRQFQARQVPAEVIAQILEAGRLTHTAKNLQDVSFVVLDREKDRVERLAVALFKRVKPFADLFSPMARNNRIDGRFFFHGAPVVLVVLAKDKTNGLLAAQNMEFVAEANGLGVLFSGFFAMAANASRRIKKALGVPGGKRVAAALVLGYPDVTFLRSPPRKPLDVNYL